MPIGNFNLQWLNHNSQRSYTLADWGSAEDDSATIKIPDDFLVGLDFPIHAGLSVQPEKFYIKTLGIYPTGYSVTVGYDDGSDYPTVASVSVASDSHTENRSYALAGSDDYDDSVGKIVIGRLDSVALLPSGLFTFSPTATPLETDCIRPMIRGISSLTVINGNDRSDPIYGDIELVAGTNMRLVANLVEGQSPEIVFSAISGEGLNEECACEEVVDSPAIRYINGIPPLIDGNFRMVGSSCLTVAPITNGLQLTDTCSEPCCGCEELDALTRQIERFADGVITFQTFVGGLRSEVSQMSQVVLGSRLSDQGCSAC